jgi:hypothetical protein
LPFDGDVGELIDAHLRQVPTPPSARNPAIPPAWDAIVLHCLEKARDDRFGTMDEIDAAIADPAAHLLVYQQQVATRAASGPHRTAVLPRELRPDHVAAARASYDAGGGGGLAVTAVSTPVPASVVPLYSLTPTPPPSPAPMGTPAPFMAATPHETPIPTEVAKPRARLLLWIGTGVAVAAAGAVFIAGLLMRGPTEPKEPSDKPIPTRVVTSAGSATPAPVVPPPRTVEPASTTGSAAGSAASTAGSAQAEVGSAAPAAGSARAEVGSAQAGDSSAQRALDVVAPIRLAINTDPAGAKVVIKRGSKTWTGTSPDVIELTAGEKPEPLTITVVAPGYRTVTQTITPRKDAEILIVLTRIPVDSRKPRRSNVGDDLIRP